MKTCRTCGRPASGDGGCQTPDSASCLSHALVAAGETISRQVLSMCGFVEQNCELIRRNTDLENAIRDLAQDPYNPSLCQQCMALAGSFAAARCGRHEYVVVPKKILEDAAHALSDCDGSCAYSDVIDELAKFIS